MINSIPKELNGELREEIRTFFITKLWYAWEIRGDKKEDILRTYFLVYEISKCKTAEKFMESKLTETRKFRLKFVLTEQYGKVFLV